MANLENHCDVESTPDTGGGSLDGDTLSRHRARAETVDLPDGKFDTLVPQNDVSSITEQTIICVICLEIVEEPATALPCQHSYFHFPCLGTWLQQNRSCPLCKVNISGVLYIEGLSNSYRTFHPADLDDLHSSPGQPNQRGHARSRSGFPRRHRRGSATHQADSSINFRRQIYDLALPSLYVGNNRVSRYRNITPLVIASDPTLIPRARKWIRRELRALDPFGQNRSTASPSFHGSDENMLQNIEYLLEYVVAILKHIDLKGSAGQAEILLREHIGSENARLFLHELESWLRSPFTTLEEWDNCVQYSHLQ